MFTNLILHHSQSDQTVCVDATCTCFTHSILHIGGNFKPIILRLSVRLASMFDWRVIVIDCMLNYDLYDVCSAIYGLEKVKVIVMFINRHLSKSRLLHGCYYIRQQISV